MGMSVVELTLTWAEYKFQPRADATPSFPRCAVILFLAGVVVLIKAKAVANWISDKLE